MADMLRISLSGSMVKLVQSREEPAQLRIVIIDVLMNSEQPGTQGYSTVRFSLPHWYYVTYPTTTADGAHITCHYF